MEPEVQTSSIPGQDNTPTEGRSPAEVAASISESFNLWNLAPDFRRAVLAELVGTHVELPSYSTLGRAEISVVAKATVGTGVVPIFKHPLTEEWCAVVVRPGTHYVNPYYEADSEKPFYMTAGGFINLSCIQGKAENEPDDPSRAEHPHEGGSREVREEIVYDTGAPVLNIDPSRLVPADLLTLSFRSGEKRLVIGYFIELDSQEIASTLSHVDRVRSDPEYRQACREHTINPETGRPEICQVDILPLERLVDESILLLHRDQRSLFKKIHDRVTRSDSIQ